MRSDKGGAESPELNTIELSRDHMVDHPAGAHYVLWNGPAFLDVGMPGGGFVRFAVANLPSQWTLLMDGHGQPLPVAARNEGRGLSIWWLPYDGPGAPPGSATHWRHERRGLCGGAAETLDDALPGPDGCGVGHWWLVDISPPVASNCRCLALSCFGQITDASARRVDHRLNRCRRSAQAGEYTPIPHAAVVGRRFGRCIHTAHDRHRAHRRLPGRRRRSEP